jgi:hypothetical protein
VQNLDLGRDLVLLSDSKSKTGKVQLPVTKLELFRLFGQVLAGNLTEETSNFSTGKLVLVKTDGQTKMYLTGMEDYHLLFNPEEMTAYFRGIQKRKFFELLENGLTEGATLEGEIKSFYADFTAQNKLHERFLGKHKREELAAFRKRVQPFIREIKNGRFGQIAA